MSPKVKLKKFSECQTVGELHEALSGLNTDMPVSWGGADGVQVRVYEDCVVLEEQGTEIDT